MKKFKKILSIVLLVSFILSASFLTGCIVPGNAIDSDSGSGSSGGSGSTGGSSDSGSDDDSETEVELLDPNEYFAQGLKFIYRPTTENSADTIQKLSTQAENMALDLCYRLVNFYGVATATTEVDSQSLGYSISANEKLVNWKSATIDTDKFIGTTYSTDLIEGDWIVKEATAGSNDEILASQYLIAFLYIGANANVLDDETFKTEVKDLKENANKSEYYNNKAKNYLKNIDHLGLLDYQQEQFINIILTEIIGDTVVNKDNTLFTDNDGVEGFGSEVFFDGNGEYDSNESYEDKNNNGYLDLWTKQKFIQEEYCTEETYSWETYHYIRKSNGEEEYVLNGIIKPTGLPNYSYTIKRANGTYIEGTTEPIIDSNGYYDKNEIYIDLNGNGVFDAWTKETFIAKYSDCTENTYTYENWHYTIGSDGAVEIKINGIKQNPTAEELSTTYKYDTKKTRFKNYKNIVNFIVDQMANVSYTTGTGENSVNVVPYQASSLLSVQDLKSSEFANNFDISDNAEFFNQNIATNSSSNYSLQSVVFMPSKDVVLQEIPFDLEYYNTSTGAPTQIKIKASIRYYVKSTNTLFEKQVSTFTIKNMKYDLVESNDCSINFETLATQLGLTDGFKLSAFTNNCGTNASNSATPPVKAIADLDANAQSCFIVEQNSTNDGSLVKYADYETDFLEIVFDAEKIDGVTPSFKVGITALDFSDPNKIE